MKIKLHSKKGFTLVETVCAILIFAIVTVGVLNAVAFSREMIYSNNEREKASDKAQLLADEIISTATGKNPENADDLTSIVTLVDAYAKQAADPADNDVQIDAIGSAKYVSDFTEPTDEADVVQYKIRAVTSDTDKEVKQTFTVEGRTQEVTLHETLRPGWEIEVRVYYKMIGGTEWRSVDITAFAPRDMV